MIPGTDGSAGQLINPDKNYDEVHTEAAKSHDLYVLTHNDFNPSEHLSRYYANSSFNPKRTFGMQTPHDNTGLQTKKSLRWWQTTEAEKLAPLVSKREDDFRERTQHQLGKTLDPYVISILTVEYNSSAVVCYVVVQLI